MAQDGWHGRAPARARACHAVRLAACPWGTIAVFSLCPLQGPLNCWLRSLRKTVSNQCVESSFFQRRPCPPAGPATLDRAGLSGDRRAAA
jgi:hypothetical protein